MKRTVATMILHGEYRVTRDDSRKTNPYSVNYIWHNNGKHQKQLMRYGDLASCMIMLQQIALANNQE